MLYHMIQSFKLTMIHGTHSIKHSNLYIIRNIYIYNNIPTKFMYIVERKLCISIVHQST